MSSPTSQFLAAAMVTESVHDAGGRELVLRRMTALDRLRLFKTLGPVLSQNAPYLGMAMLASCVMSIDGMPIPAPGTEPQLEALIAKLGDVGIAAVADAIAKVDLSEMGSAAKGN